MKFLTRVFATFLFTTSAALAGQGTQTNQVITSIQAGQNLGLGFGAVVIYFASTNAGTLPTCVKTGPTGQDKGFGIDPSTAQGRAAIALAEAAFLAGKTVAVAGTGQCTIYPQTEDLGYLYTTD